MLFQPFLLLLKLERKASQSLKDGHSDEEETLVSCCHDL